MLLNGNTEMMHRGDWCLRWWYSSQLVSSLWCPDRDYKVNNKLLNLFRTFLAAVCFYVIIIESTPLALLPILPTKCLFIIVCLHQTSVKLFQHCSSKSFRCTFHALNHSKSISPGLIYYFNFWLLKCNHWDVRLKGHEVSRDETDILVHNCYIL